MVFAGGHLTYDLDEIQVGFECLPRAGAGRGVPLSDQCEVRGPGLFS
nr:unnamed protein product [Digitaria exilis]